MVTHLDKSGHFGRIKHYLDLTSRKEPWLRVNDEKIIRPQPVKPRISCQHGSRPHACLNSYNTKLPYCVERSFPRFNRKSCKKTSLGP